ncbi:MAG: hypothetical protein WD689_04375 [Gaiellaceae bacterium]
MKKWFAYAGIAASVVLIAFGIGAIALGVNGFITVRDSLAAEKIVGGDDMSPALIREAAEEAGLTEYTVPGKDVVGQEIDTGDEARAFAGYMRIHALESTGGLTYAEMGRFATPDGNPAGTSDPELALTDEGGEPVSNGARNLWVTATALTTALNVSFMAERLAIFGIVVGVALLLSGIGFLVLTIGGALGVAVIPQRRWNASPDTASAAI